jgi:TonB family protein
VFKHTLALAAHVVAIVATPQTTFAADSMTMKSALVAHVESDVAAVSAGDRTDAAIVRSVPAEMPSFEELAKIGGTATVEINLDAKGTLTSATVLNSSGRARLDRSALDAVRASTYRAATLNGRSVGGSYLVEVVLDPS